MWVASRTLKTGTFYFGGNRNFLLWSDTGQDLVAKIWRSNT